MIIIPRNILGSAAVPGQIEAAASTYDSAAQRLMRVASKVPDYQDHLNRAESVEWQSMAGTAFRDVIDLLRGPGRLIGDEAASLAAEAQTIATDLRGYAAQARHLAALLAPGALPTAAPGPAWDIAAAGIEWIWREAKQSLEGDAAGFMRYIDQHGGIPAVLEDTVRRNSLLNR